MDAKIEMKEKISLIKPTNTIATSISTQNFTDLIDYENDMKLITIIGTGVYGVALGKRFIKFGFNVNYGSRKPNKSFIENNFSEEEQKFATIKVMSIKDAWNNAEKIIFIAVRPCFYQDLVEEIYLNSTVQQVLVKNESLKEKIVIEVSNVNSNATVTVGGGSSSIQTSNNNNNNNNNGSSLTNASRYNQTNKVIKPTSSNILTSNAELLQETFDVYSKNNEKVLVVKAFNTISAYAMGNDYSDRFGKGGIASTSFGSGEIVPIACNSKVARDHASNLCNRIGFRAVYVGPLTMARKLEQINDHTFSDWFYPSIFCILFFVFNLVWTFFYNYITSSLYKTFQEYIENFSVIYFVNKIAAFTSFNLLTYVYLAGIVASIYQLCYGTKTKKFPIYLDRWLKSRKHLGLWAFLFAIIHLIISVIILDHGYFESWFKPISNGVPTKLTVHAEFNVLSGLFAFILMALLALSSINSINASFNWSEWVFVQTKLGYLCLTMALLHVLIMFSRIFWNFSKYTTSWIFTRTKFLVLWLPLIVILFKLIFTYFKPISKRLDNIRNGIEKNKSEHDANKVSLSVAV